MQETQITLHAQLLPQPLLLESLLQPRDLQLQPGQIHVFVIQDQENAVESIQIQHYVEQQHSQLQGLLQLALIRVEGTQDLVNVAQ